MRNNLSLAKSPNPAGRLTARSARYWLRSNLFSSLFSSILTIALISGLAWCLIALFKWAVLHAAFSGSNPAICNDATDGGACWIVLPEKFRLMMFGLYPYHEQWRPAISLLLMLALYVASAFRRLWSRTLLVCWIVGLAAIAILMWGGVFDLPFVPDDSWGGLPVTLFLATFGLAPAFPAAILLAMARTSRRRPELRAVVTVYIELVRAIPMVIALFIVSLMFPLLLPHDINVSKLLRVLIAIILFAAAYLAEVIRGGLESLPRGQEEAAQALGLTYWKTMRYVLLPQALRSVIPSIVNTFIGFFKATSIVSIVGIFDLLTAAQRSAADPSWAGAGNEIYLFVGAVYFIFCFSMSRYSRALEHRLKQASDR